MSHNINNDNFMSYRLPAWHKLGVVFDTPLTALQAAAKIDLPYIHTEPVISSITNLATSHKAIIGTQKDQVPHVYTVVSGTYRDLPHDLFLEAFDTATDHSPIETLGLLGQGETLFVTTQLPKFDVKGDEIDSYLLAYNPLIAGQAATGRITSVRVVCQNTLDASGHNFSKQFRVIHYKDAAHQLLKQLREYWLATEQATQTLKEAYEILASTAIDDLQLHTLAESVYPTSEVPNLPATDENLVALAEWETRNKSQLVSRESVYNLYHGQGVGSQSRAAQGTAWGAYNAVVEYEDYCKKYRKAESVVFGAGYDRKVKAFTESLALAQS